MHASRGATILLAWGLAGCPSTTGGSAGGVGDGAPPAVDVGHDSTAPAGPCAWRVGEAVVLDAPTSATAHRALLDLQPAEGGAWALFSDDAGGARQADTVLERLSPTGHRRAAGVRRFPSGFSPTSASLAVDEALGRRAVLAEVQGTGGERCSLGLLSADGSLTTPREVTLPGGGFSLAGCRALLAQGPGYTFLSEQVRALWGVSLVQLDAAGATPAQLAPGVLEGFPPVTYARFGLPTGGFALLWAQPAPGGGGAFTLNLHRFTDDGQPREAPLALRSNAPRLRALRAVGTRLGLLALWEEPAGGGGVWDVYVRVVDGSGRPGALRPVMFEGLGGSQGGLAVAAAGGEVLVGLVAGSGVLRPVVVPLSLDGSTQGAMLALPTPPGTTRVEGLQLVPTSTGALAVFTTEPGAFPNRAVAVPLTCGR